MRFQLIGICLLVVVGSLCSIWADVVKTDGNLKVTVSTIQPKIGEWVDVDIEYRSDKELTNATFVIWPTDKDNQVLKHCEIQPKLNYEIKFKLAKGDPYKKHYRIRFNERSEFCINIREPELLERIFQARNGVNLF